MDNNEDRKARAKRGAATLRQLDPGGVELMDDALGGYADDMRDYVMEFAFGDILSRPGLDPKTREMLTVTSLATLGNAQSQLDFHIRAALNQGCTRQEIIEIMMQVAVYAGFPAGLNGMYLAKEIFDDLDSEDRVT